MPHYFDVVIAGGGPAGATLARGLALGGARVALLERQRFPCYKSCAGGIPIRTERLLDFSIAPVIEDTVSALDITHLGRRSFRRDAGAPIARMVMRDRFHALLLEGAHDAGAFVLDGAAVRGVAREAGGSRVDTAEGGVTCAFVAGADGANSRVARSLGLGAGMFENVALEAEVRAARSIARLFYRCLRRSPALTLEVARRVSYLWSTLFRVLRGESTYDSELNRWPLLTAVARLLPAAP